VAGDGQALPRRRAAALHALVVVAVVEHVDEVGVKGVDVVQLRKGVDDAAELVVERLLRKLDLAHVKVADARDLVPAHERGGEKRAWPLAGLRQQQRGGTPSPENAKEKARK
jgi:hypothetical protein